MSGRTVSVIVPVYKAEKYLRECFDSLVNQTYPDMEIILVDDGSPGDAPKICDEYAKKYKNVKVVHRENGGIAAARNTGLAAATGDFIGFCDCDDYVSKTYYAELMRVFDELPEADIAVTTCVNFLYKNRINHVLSHAHLKETALRLTEKESLNFELYHAALVWSKIFRRGIIGDTRFRELMGGDDYAFNVDLLKKSPVVALIKSDSNAEYFWRMRQTSVSHTNAPDGPLTWMIPLGELHALSEQKHIDFSELGTMITGKDFRSHPQYKAMKRMCKRGARSKMFSKGASIITRLKMLLFLINIELFIFAKTIYFRRKANDPGLFE